MLSARHRRRTALVPLAMLLALALSVQATTDSRRVTFTIPTAPMALGLDAHEMTHVGQVELAGGQGRASQWMAEGVADWASLVVLDRLRLQPMQAERDGRLASIHTPRAPIDLGGLDDPRDFIERSRRDGTDTTYGVSFALADRLIDRYGFARTREYFQAFAHERDRALNFRAGFGETPEDLARRLWPAACHC